MKSPSSTFREFMMRRRLITNFRRLSEADFQVQEGRVQVAMQNNPYFPLPWSAPAPSLQQIEPAYEVYHSAFLASATRDTVRIAERNAARRVVEDLLQKLASYVEFVAQDDEAALQSSGFELRRESTRIDRSAPPPAPANLRVEHGALSGQLVVRFSRVPGAASYDMDLTFGDPNVEAGWKHALNSSLCTGVLRDLPRLQTCWIRVRALMGQDFGPWSEPAVIVVL
jgi:hypothetical protein